MKPQLRISLKSRVFMASACLLLSSAACAQYAPDASMDLGTGYGQIGMSQSILDGTRAIDGKTSPRQAQTQPAAQPSRADMAAMWKRIEPEYNRRVREDGKASADRWLAAAAREMGKHAGQEARQR